LSEPTVCPKCQGTGWLLEDAGGSQVAKRCACFGERWKQSLFDQANIPRRYQSCTLDNFEVHNDTHRDALKI
jgi:DNA replication protein DnaC